MCHVHGFCTGTRKYALGYTLHILVHDPLGSNYSSTWTPAKYATQDPKTSQDIQKGHDSKILLGFRYPSPPRTCDLVPGALKGPIRTYYLTICLLGGLGVGQDSFLQIVRILLALQGTGRLKPCNPFTPMTWRFP